MNPVDIPNIRQNTPNGAALDEKIELDEVSRLFGPDLSVEQQLDQLKAAQKHEAAALEEFVRARFCDDE